MKVKKNIVFFLKRGKKIKKFEKLTLFFNNLLLKE